MRFALLCLIAFTAIGLSSKADAQTADLRLTDVLPNLSASTIEPVLANMGYRTERITLTTGDVALGAVRLSDGRSIVLRPRVCDENGACFGLYMIANLEMTAPLEVLNAYNSTSPPTRAIINRDNGNQVTLTRYLIADHGIVAGSLAVNINVFVSGIDHWFSTVDSIQQQMVSFTPLMPLSASDEESQTGTVESHLYGAQNDALEGLPPLHQFVNLPVNRVNLP